MLDLVRVRQCRYVSGYLFVNGDFFSVLAFRPKVNGFFEHQNLRFSKTVPSGDFLNRRLIVFVWTDENGVLEERRKKYPDTCGQSLNFKARFLPRKLKEKRPILKPSLEIVPWYYSQTPLIMTLGRPQKVFVLTGCPYKGVNFRENLRAFFPQGHCKLFVIMRCPY